MGNTRELDRESVNQTEKKKREKEKQKYNNSEYRSMVMHLTLSEIKELNVS